jgi:hypothetical protein
MTTTWTRAWCRILGFACVAVLAQVGTSGATDITSCGETVAAGDTGDLQADLDCGTDFYFFGVRLLANSTLRLNGHSIVGGPNTFATVLGVTYADDEEPDEAGRGKFMIVGPGEIAGAGADPQSYATTRACVTLQNGRATLTSPTGVIDIHGCNFGVAGYILEYSTNRARVTLDHVVVHDNSQEGVTVRKITASHVTAYGNHESGLTASSTLIVDDVDSHDNVHGNGLYGARTVKGSNVTVTGNYCGVSSTRAVTLTNLSSIANTGVCGVQGRRVRLTDSVVTDNNVDIIAASAPILIDTTCGTSRVAGSSTSEDWGVCAND